MSRRLGSVIVLVVCLGVAAPACGRSQAQPEAPPPPVPAELVPPALNNGTFQMIENTDEKTVAAFAGEGEQTLIGDGKLWEIRDAQQLIGTLQIATLKSRVDVTDPDARQRFVRGLMPGAVNRMEVEGVTVFATSSNDKSVYLWFGPQLYQVVQLKGATLDGEGLLNELIGFQLSTPRGQDLLLRDDFEEF